MNSPLAEELRPKTLKDLVGQEEVLSPGKPLYEAIKNDQLFSFILYAPPGVGKSSICFLIKQYTQARFKAVSAIQIGVKEVRAIIEEAKAWKERQNKQTVLFLDEIHRFTKSQQDSLLGAVERGEIILIGATTQNPSFEVNAALISRLQVFRLEALSNDSILQILLKAKDYVKNRIEFCEEEALQILAQEASGDARKALRLFEASLPTLSKERISKLLQTQTFLYDKSGDQHYEVISAFIKSMRASQTEAALYYFVRMWEAGEDPLFIARRMVIFASEDVGNADLKALALTNAVRHAVEFVGRPECYYALTQGVIYLSQAKKSRHVGEAFSKAQELVKKTKNAPVPRFLTNAVTSLDKEFGKGRAREDSGFLPLSN